MINFEGKNPLTDKVSKAAIQKLDNILPADNIEKIINTLRTRAELEIPDKGTFRAISEKFTNHKPVITVGDISVNIKSTSSLNTSEERVLEAAVSTKSGGHILERELVRGKREDILNYLNDKEFPQKFKEFLMDCSENFDAKGLE